MQKIKANNCIDLPYKNKPSHLETYTIRKIFVLSGDLFILLKGITNAKINVKTTEGIKSIEPGFHYSRFFYNDDRNYVLDYEVVMKWYLKQNSKK